MLIIGKFVLGVFILADLIIAWGYAMNQDICKVVIFCTAAICGMMSLCM